MLFDPRFFLDNLGLIFALFGALVLAKAVLIGGIATLFGYGARSALLIGLGLSQVGEFAFVIINVGRDLGGISSSGYSLMIAVTVVSMIATPMFFSLSAFVSKLLGSQGSSIPVVLWDSSNEPRQEHVVIIGAGVVGRYVAQVLSSLKRPFVVIESDYKIALQLRDEEVPVIFGDATRQAILEAAAVSQSALVVITSTNDQILPSVIYEVRQMRPDLPVIVRVQEVEDLHTLASLKVEEIVQPQMEVGLEMVRQALLALKIEEQEIFAQLSRLRSDRYENYPRLRGRP
jgi:CPA2 family monovalent cation:H+ antiporter-2